MNQTVNHNNQKKIALINDYSGFGRCSVAVQLPIISMMKVQCCPVPTSIFSNHTGFEKFAFTDFTDNMDEYLQMWDYLGLEFAGVCSGFLGSARQIDIVRKFIEKSSKSIVVIDPVMGDYGKVYATYTDKMCQEMKNLVSMADIVTPNLTEACILTNTDYREDFTDDELMDIIGRVSDMGAKRVVITGIPRGEELCNLCYDATGERTVTNMVNTHKVGTSRSGTGDIFAAIIVADAVNGVPFERSVRKAADFIRQCILKSIEMEIPVTDGVPFEEVLYKLGQD